MNSALNLEARVAAAQVHALTAVRREICARDSAASCKYLRDFTRSFDTYERALTGEEFEERIEAAGILLVGDYHALPASQKFASSLLERLAQHSPVVLGVEAVFSRDQRILDSWWRREIDEVELRERLRFDREWGYEWECFYELLTAGRDHGEGVYGLDCVLRDDLRRIRSRDRHAVGKLCEMHERHPQAKILALCGESHMAPQHLPTLLRKALPDERPLTILQNIDALYWRAIGEEAAVVSIDEETVCVFNSSPLEKYESYRICLERWNAVGDEPPDFAPAVYNLIFSLARCLGFRLDSAQNENQPKFLADSVPEVISVRQDADDVFGPTKLAAELVGPGPARRRIEQVRSAVMNRLEQHGCVYIPAANRFLVREFRLSEVAAEAARFLHHACAGSRSLEARDGTRLEDAMAHLGSRLLCPGMMEQGGDPLGESLYQDYLGGRITRADLRRVFRGVASRAR
jgi:Haem-binding uptake, Tiki superfamily, ChaN